MTAQADEDSLADADFELPNSIVANTAVRVRAGGSVFDSFTERARRVVSTAHDEAYRHVPDYIGTEHLLLGLITDSAVAEMLRALGLDTDIVRKHTEAMIGPVQPARPAHLPYSPRAKEVLERSPQEAALRGDDLADAEHILLALSHDIRSAAVKTLTALGVEPARIRSQLRHHWDRA
jgi:ATP-dependent Clp protease ATP-binding subunit ClpC